MPPVVRNNLVVALGDLVSRFPNTLEPWTPNIYATLEDSDTAVRHTAITVITHLLLADILKVRPLPLEMKQMQYLEGQNAALCKRQINFFLISKVISNGTMHHHPRLFNSS